MTPTTRQQREALARVFDRSYDDNATQPPIHPVNRRRWLQGYRAFRKTVHPGPGCIMVPWCGMWLGIEPDGYTHS